MNTTVQGTFRELGDYPCPLDGSVTVNDEDEVVAVNIGGIGLDELEDGIYFDFTSVDGSDYSNEDMAEVY